MNDPTLVVDLTRTRSSCSSRSACVLFLALALAAPSAACTSETAPASTTGDEDERGATGVPPSAGEYCTMAGYTLRDSTCTFPDGSSCEQWAFYRGECAPTRTFCAQRGGTIRTANEDMGGWTAVYGVCAVDGKECKESAFIKSKVCDGLDAW